MGRFGKIWRLFTSQEQQLLLCLAPFAGTFYYEWGNIKDYLIPLSEFHCLPVEPDEVFYPFLQRLMSLGLMQQQPAELSFMAVHPIFQHSLRRELRSEKWAFFREVLQQSFQQHYQEIAKDLYAKLHSGEPAHYREAIEVLEWEYPNFLEAGWWGLDTGVHLLLITAVAGKYFSHYQRRSDWVAYSLQLKKQMDDRAEGADFSVYMALLDSIGNNYLELRQPELARRYFEEAINLCETIDEPDGQVLRYQSSLYNNLGNCLPGRREQLELQQKALAIAQQLKDDGKAANIAYNISEAYFELRELAQSQKYLRIALESFQNQGDPFGQVKAYQSLSAHWQAQQQWEKAEEVLSIALSIVREMRDKGVEGALLQELASLKYACGEVAAAAQYSRASIPLFTQSGDIRQLANAYNLLSVLAFEEQELADGMTYAERALALFNEAGDQAQMAQSFLNIAIVTYKQGWYPEAITELEKATRLYQAIGDRHSAERSRILLAAALAELEQYAEAKAVCQAVMAFFASIPDATEMINVARVARVVWEATGDEALEKEMKDYLSLLAGDEEE